MKQIQHSASAKHAYLICYKFISEKKWKHKHRESSLSQYETDSVYSKKLSRKINIIQLNI